MLEVYLLQQCNVVNMRVLANCCVWNYTPVEKHGLRITLALEIFRFPHFRSVFVHTKYTSNMAACYVNDANDVTVFVSCVEKKRSFVRRHSSRGKRVRHSPALDSPRLDHY